MYKKAYLALPVTVLLVVLLEELLPPLQPKLTPNKKVKTKGKKITFDNFCFIFLTPGQYRHRVPNAASSPSQVIVTNS